MTGAGGRNWWETRGYAAALVLLAALPLLWPDILPLVDLTAHIGRYSVQLDLANSPALQQFYGFEWRWIGNLGVDLLILPFGKIFGVELGTKLIVMAIPPLTVAGFLAVAQAVHGRLPPTAALALPLAYAFPFQFGFVNFALSMALSMLAFALWLNLASRPTLRAALFVPLSIALWTVHVFGWAVLGLLAFTAGIVRNRDAGHGWIAAIFRGGIGCLPLAPPALLMFAWRSEGSAGTTGDWFNWDIKRAYFVQILRDRWQLFDLLSLIALVAALAAALRSASAGFSRMFALAALVLAVTYVLLPRILIGSAYADMRLAPFALAIAILAIRFRPDFSRRALHWIALASCAFFVARIAGHTASFWLYDRTYDRTLEAVAHIPPHARMVSFVGKPCREDWAKSRLDHLPALALVRKQAFSNDQWDMPGAQLLSVRLEGAAPFTADPSQFVFPTHCAAAPWRSIDQALASVPAVFDYLWLIDAPTFDARSLGNFHLVWRNDMSALYKRDGRDISSPDKE
ncbi:hypothetical protein [Sphingomonas sp. LaA6.9]|uniref:hypothetical protein n=1 Tax=Sphingomonas sp. LaA6.9 TaxID=2919914 RepID=UPI001F503BD2|nr:hypothetical protein [Sphingomonas sp. LaA6.9]MCJ8158760.1 hypothetical protein [Sphingomonas sp. LaA6.9]